MRRVVIATCLLTAIGAGAGAAVAAPSTPVHSDNKTICVVTSNDDDHRNIQYYCIGLPV